MTDSTTGRTGDTGDFERELAAAMSEYAGRFEPGVYRVGPARSDRARAGRARGARRGWSVLGGTRGARGRAAVAVAVAVAVVTGVVALALETPAGKPPAPVPSPFSTTSPTPTPPTTPPTTPPNPATGTPTTASSLPGGILQPDYAKGTLVSRELFLAAEQYENPATRSEVDLTKVAALFVDQASFRQTWGDGGLGVTCGQVADGEEGGQLFRGPRLLPQEAMIQLTPALTAVTGITCQATDSHMGGTPEALYYGGLVQAGQISGAAARRAGVRQLEQQYLVAGLRSSDGSASPTTCRQPLPRAWVIDDATEGTIVWGWKVTLDGDPTFSIGYGRPDDPSGSTGALMTRVTCTGG